MSAAAETPVKQEGRPPTRPVPVPFDAESYSRDAFWYCFVSGTSCRVGGCREKLPDTGFPSEVTVEGPMTRDEATAREAELKTLRARQEQAVLEALYIAVPN